MKVRLIRILDVVKPIRGRLPDIQHGVGNGFSVHIQDTAGEKQGGARVLRRHVATV